MSKQYRKLQEKLYQKQSDNKPAEKKIGKDYVLMAVTIFTLFVTIAEWMQFDNVSRGMYALLSASLILTYARRHAQLSEKAAVLVERASLITMVLAVLLFLATLFVHFTS